MRLIVRLMVNFDNGSDNVLTIIKALCMAQVGPYLKTVLSFIQLIEALMKNIFVIAI